jgi:hypothetical protein
MPAIHRPIELGGARKFLSAAIPEHSGALEKWNLTVDCTLL